MKSILLFLKNEYHLLIPNLDINKGDIFFNNVTGTIQVWNGYDNAPEILKLDKSSGGLIPVQTCYRVVMSNNYKYNLPQLYNLGCNAREQVTYLDEESTNQLTNISIYSVRWLLEKGFKIRHETSVVDYFYMEKGNLYSNDGNQLNYSKFFKYRKGDKYYKNWRIVY